MMKSTDHKPLTIDERVQDRHRTVGDTGVWVDLLQHYEGASAIVGKGMSSPDEHAHKGFIKPARGEVIGRSEGGEDRKICTFVNVRGVSLLSRLVALLLIASRRRGLLASLFLLCRRFSASRCLSASGGGLLFSGFGRHSGWI